MAGKPPGSEGTAFTAVPHSGKAGRLPSQGSTQGNYKGLLDGGISRRQFGKALAAIGFSAAAAESLTRMISEADAQTLPPERGRTVEGTGAEILVEALLAAGVEYLFATTATGMTAIFRRAGLAAAV